jgi:REP element-mobilizing transposase RayT
MVQGYHVIFSTYGFWLPNDPRGSWSEFVGAWELFRFGPATKTTERRSLAYDCHDISLRREAKRALKYHPVRLTGLQARAVARGFAEYVQRSKITIWACSVMPDHVHLVLAPNRLLVEPLVNKLKGCATRQLRAEELFPISRTCWSRGQWKVFLNSGQAIDRAIRYVERNPIREGMRQQHWSFVHPR